MTCCGYNKGLCRSMLTIFHVIAEPSRRGMLDLLRGEARSVGELVSSLGLSQPNVSKHLRVMRDAGLMSVTIDAQWRRYALRPEALREVDRWLNPYRELWKSRLDDLERHLDTRKETP